MSLLFEQIVNGCVQSAVLFLLASGLALISGLIKVINLAHGSFFMLGAFCGLSAYQATGSFVAALLVAPLLVGGGASIVEIVLMRRIYGRSPLDQVLLTFGLSFIASDIVESIWGKGLFSLPEPELMTSWGGQGIILVPAYRLSLIVVGAAWALFLWHGLERTRVGARLRAGLDDSRTASALGVNVPKLRTLTFAAGAALAAVGGVLAAPLLGVSSNLDVEALVPSLLVVALGGLGSLRGAALASLAIGICDTLGRAYAPNVSPFILDIFVIGILMAHPEGLGTLKRRVAA